MNAEFFALAFTAALNPKLLALDLLLIENRRPRAMFLCVLLAPTSAPLRRPGPRPATSCPGWRFWSPRCWASS